MAGRTRLKIYNNALSICGERSLSSVTEAVESRRQLDLAWDSDGVNYCLEQAQWRFAMRTQKVEYDPSISPPFGYTYAFNKPSDWVLTSAVCSDERFTSPLLQYVDELDNWFADITPIYVKFVSDNVDYGLNLAEWPQSFGDYVDAYFASKIIYKMTSDKQRIEQLMGSPGKIDGGELGRRLKIAKSRDAMTQPSKMRPPGSWSRARYGRNFRGPMGDGGTSGSLIG